jgi:hypothetical protein
MKKHRFNRRTTLVIFCLLLAIGLVFVGIHQGADKAKADLPVPTIPSITIPIPHLFLATGFAPADGATGVALNTNVAVDFNYDLAAGVLSNSTFYLQKQGSIAKIPASLSYSTVTDKAVLNPSSDLLPGTTYVVTLTSGIEDKDGYTLLNPGTWGFTTDTAPTVIVRIPEPDQLNVPVDMNITVTFSKKMDISTITSSTFYVKKQGSGSKLAGVITFSADHKTTVFNPDANLEGNTVYEVSMSPAIKSETGITPFEAGANYLFKTVATAPNVTTKTPAAGATGVPVTQSVTAVFDKEMDSSTITSATFYIIKQGGSPLPANVTYNAATKTATLDPLGDLEQGAVYEVTLSSAIKGSTGATLTGAPVVWTFTTVSAAPSVTSKVPAAGATGVPITQLISAVFDKAMDATTLTSATVYIAKQGGTPLPATVTYSAASKTVTLDPLADLEGGAIYNVTLANAIKGADGQTLTGAPVVWSFTTAAAAPSSTFTDVIAGVTPYSAAIAALAADNVITGFPDGTFRPNDFVTRQQFAKMIVLTMGYTVTGAEVCPFTDVVAQSGTDPFYPSKYVAVCAAHGVTTGKTPTTFAPYETITHQQLISMVVRAAVLSSPPAAFAPNFAPSQFSLNDHYLNARKAAYAGLLEGLLGMGPGYQFMAGSTRGECAQILYNLTVLLGS